MTIAIPKASRFGYDYRKGSPWKYETLIAEMDFPIYKTEAQLMEDRLNAAPEVIPYYKYSETVPQQTLRRVDNLFGDAGTRYVITEALSSIYDRGVLSSYPESEVIYIQKGKRADKYPTSEVYSLKDAGDAFLAELSRRSPEVNYDSLLRKSGVYDLISVNLVYDEEATNLISSQTDVSVSPTLGYVSAGQLIVSEGEIVTAEIAQMLDSYKKEYEQTVGYNRSGIMLWLGSFIVSSVMVFILLLIIFFTCPYILKGWRRYSFIITVFTVSSLVTMLVCRFQENIICLVPLTVTALYLQAFFKNSEIVPVYAVSLLPLLLFAQNGAALYIMFLVAGIVAILFFHRFSRGWKQFVTAGITFLVLALVYMAFWLTNMFSGNVCWNLLMLFCGSLMTVAFYPLVYLFEKIFNLVSTSRLLELCDTSNPVLHELELKAPGSFQHSLQVMNMADAAARAIGANVPLVRVGALYHDIGKMCNPLCFVENESILAGAKEKYHSGLTPLQSARDIIRHVSDGEALARRHRLPVIIPDFIRTHHGTTTASFFLDKYLKEGGDPSHTREFSYPGPKPSTKEQIILMLCDSIEAASRTLKDYSPETFDTFVESIVEKKLEAGQFENSDISIQELGEIKSTLKSYLAQMYHARIEYPKETKTNRLKIWKSKQKNQTL